MLARQVIAPADIGSVTDSRHALLAEIGDAPDLTLARGFGNVGDELILAGTRCLLSGHVYREIGIEELAGAGGGTVLLSGGGAFSHAYNEYMPEVLAVAELRFDRVIVLPSSFDVSVDRVRDALRRTAATVFAREHESYRRIAGLCRARLAHDCAFFFDYTRYRAAGDGTLNAFRTDRERATAGAPLPAGNDDISATRTTLDEWLAAIARHRVVRTDRAHVMIAAALMGKRVEFASCSYFKVDALADGALRDFDVRRIPAPLSCTAATEEEPAAAV
jgi:exopolysaccharide biosynthesis predicted pyruvyltransferase EpsI